MNGGEFATAVNALALAIAENKTPDDLAILSTLFMQLGDTLTTIATQNIRLQDITDNNKTASK